MSYLQRVVVEGPRPWREHIVPVCRAPVMLFGDVIATHRNPVTPEAAARVLRAWLDTGRVREAYRRAVFVPLITTAHNR